MDKNKMGCDARSAGHKGISPLVATVLLIVMTVALSGIIMAFTAAYTKGASESIQNKTDESLDCSGASIEISAAFLTNGTAGTIRAQVINNGLKDGLSIVGGQAFNKTGYNFTASSLPITGVDRGEIAVVNFHNVSVQTCADLSYITLSTQCPAAEDKFSGAKCV